MLIDSPNLNERKTDSVGDHEKRFLRSIFL
jgi:hypothetical protein